MSANHHPVIASVDGEMVDVSIAPGVKLELTVDDGEVRYHGLGIEDRHNVGCDDPISGVALPEGDFTKWVLRSWEDRR